jgi:hypothetical protein
MLDGRCDFKSSLEQSAVKRDANEKNTMQRCFSRTVMERHNAAAVEFLPFKR